MSTQAATKSPELTPEVSASRAVQAIIRRHALEAAWPSSNQDQIKSILMRMATEISACFGKTPDDISLESLRRTIQFIEEYCEKFGIHKLSYGHAKKAADVVQKASEATAIISHVYWIGSAFSGNFGPAIRKLGLKTGGAPLARSAGVWLAGQAIAELYFDPAKFQGEKRKATSYTALFDGFSLEQCRELASYMGIDARVSWDIEKIKQEILSEITAVYHNKVTALWSDVPEYRLILLSLCSELEIPGVNLNDTDDQLEERIVQKVFAERLENMTPDQLKKFELAIKSSMEDQYWSSSLKSSLFASGLVAGNMSGFGLFIAATSSLAAVARGLGITFAFTTYTTLSSAMSLVFGPLGIASAATVAALHWTKARPKKTLPFVLYMAAARGQLAASSQPLSILKRLQQWLLKSWIKLTPWRSVIHPIRFGIKQGTDL